jgi:hypothetical protein
MEPWRPIEPSTRLRVVANAEARDCVKVEVIYPLPEQMNRGYEGQGYAKQRQPLKSAIHGPV